MFDLIGDIHGHADSLVRLLEKLGYRRDGRGFCHSSRQVIFVGDFIDRGPAIAEVLQIARSMVEAGAAKAVMGNHEFNALAFHTPDPEKPGDFLRPHSDKNVHQHQATIDQISAADMRDYLAWFRTLPMSLELDSLRIVHACWDGTAIDRIEQRRTAHGGVTAEFLTEATLPASQLFHDIEDVLKGPEAELPASLSFRDKDGNERNAIRARWYLSPVDHSYRTYALQADEVDCDEPLTAAAAETARVYPADAKPVLFGHYWLKADQPSRLARNVACLDYSVAKGGYLCAYRWDGEMEIEDGKFVVLAAV